MMERRSRYVNTLPWWQNFLTRSQQIAVLQICRGKENEKIDMYDSPVHDCTQEQDDSPYFYSIVQQCKWPSLLRKTVEIQKFCYYGNVASHFSSVLFKLTACLVVMVNHVTISRKCAQGVSSHRHPKSRPQAGLKPRGRNCLVPVKCRT